MKEETINLAALRANTRQVVERVSARGRSVLVQVNGKPAAAIVGVNEYREWSELKRARAARQRRFRLIRQSAKRNAMSESDAIQLAQEASNASPR